MWLHLSALIALMRGLSMSPPRCPCPVFCMYLSVEACLSPSLPFAVFALRLVGCDNVCCSSLVLSITAGSGRFPAVNSQSIYVPFGLVNSKKNVCCVWEMHYTTPSANVVTNPVKADSTVNGYTPGDPGARRPPRVKFAPVTPLGYGRGVTYGPTRTGSGAA